MHFVRATVCRALIVVGALSATTLGEESQWRKLPPLPGRTDHVGPIAVEGNTLWASGGNSVAYWTGSEWRVPADKLLKGGQYLTQFYGGGDRLLLFSQPGEKEHEGRLYRLTEGSAEYLTEFHYDGRTVPPYLGVTRAGDIYSVSTAGLRVFHDGQWNATAEGTDRQVWVCDTDKAVCFYSPVKGKLFRFDPKSGFSERNVAIAYEGKQPMVRFAQWGADRALVLEAGKPGVKCFDLSSGKLCDAAEVNTAIDKLRPRALRQMQDGSVWLSAFDPMTTRHQAFHIFPNGKCQPLTKLNEIDWQRRLLGAFPERILEARDGALWIAGQNEVLTRVAGGRTTRFGSETGYSLAHCPHLVEDSQGIIYSANSGGIYVWSSAGTLAHLPPPIVPSRPEAAWLYRRDKYPPLIAAWRIGKRIYAVSQNDSTRSGGWLTAVDTSTRRTRFTKVLPTRSGVDTPWLLRQTDAGLLELAVMGKILRLSAETGEPKEEVLVPHDQRIAPLPVDDDYVVVPTPRGTEIIRVDAGQKEQWRTSLPGYLQLHPTRIGERAIVQTRGSSYGGQQTLCINLMDGSIAWQDETNAYGCGVDFFDESRFLVESNSNLSPQIGEGWLIARDPQTGKRLWDYRQSGLMHHPPLIDRRTGRVYAVFQRGDVVCLRGEDGSVVWKQQLAENALASGAANSYHKAWSPHSLDNGRLLVVDRNLTLHTIDAASGEFHASIALIPPLDASPRPAIELVAAPWVIDNVAFVALTEGVVSYRLPQPKAVVDTP